ncbi:MAG: Phosphoglycerate dehydrogenase [Candidatus Roizmanbacteria bacterium GW2011_GWC2_37_13]|uniref:Phosphoglycerate dehydrogenase n=1 Tax=Candidatus Roizmanbacteria bacterium GW2011_GWC2_37_13 TaxID=1618486 RepID=A0A0G0G890_9BACT|nr:MAG: Phosphoglycerate dehydrogenase [Candidatus Roizmanbacteria bacterium GW2011_GWC1_37_12]KKQ26207.1 MAG: Phosphoglycerate dehydrogenase [Candidatus Roizmanbacteria bacterium GW2011_GWC2_37_13]
MKIILICQKEEFDNKRLLQLQKYSKVEWIDSNKTNPYLVKELFDDEEKILALSPAPLGWNFPKDLYLKLKNVKYLCLVTTSHEFLDLEKCSRAGIKVTNVPHYASEAVSEQVIMMLLVLSKRLPAQVNYKYDFSKKVLADDLLGKQVGIIGLGDIGSRVAELVKGMGMKVVYWSRKKRDFRFENCSLEKLLSSSDVVIPLVAATKETEGFLDRKKLEIIKNDAYFVGLISDKVWDKQYLLERVKKNQLAGLAFENFEGKKERLEGNVFVTPPLAWYSKQSLDKNIQEWTDTIISCIKGIPKNLVNLNI